MKKLTSIAITLFLIVLSTACSQENKPTTDQLKFAVSEKVALNGFDLKSFTIEASENMGNEVEPVFATRFKAVATLRENLYEKSGKGKVIPATFVILVSEKGKDVPVYGKIASQLYQGSWKHNVLIDGNPLFGLGSPLNEIRGERVVVKGSDEEKKYQDDVKQMIEKKRQRQEVFKKNLRNAENIFIGTWIESGTKVTYKPDGTKHTIFNDGNEAVFKWNIVGDILTSKKIKFKEKFATKFRNASGTYIEKIIYLDKNNMTLSHSGGTYDLKRVK